MFQLPQLFLTPKKHLLLPLLTFAILVDDLLVIQQFLTHHPLLEFRLLLLFLLLPYQHVPYPTSLLQLGSYLPAQIPQWTHQLVQSPVPLLPNLLKRKVNNLQIQVNTPILPNAVSHPPTNSVQSQS